MSSEFQFLSELMQTFKGPLRGESYAAFMMRNGSITREEYFRDQVSLVCGTLTSLHCHDLTKQDLASELYENGLKFSGKIADMRDRLIRHIEGKSTEADKLVDGSAKLQAEAKKWADKHASALACLGNDPNRLYPKNLRSSLEGSTTSIARAIATDWHDCYDYVGDYYVEWYEEHRSAAEDIFKVLDNLPARQLTVTLAKSLAQCVLVMAAARGTMKKATFGARGDPTEADISDLTFNSRFGEFGPEHQDVEVYADLAGSYLLHRVASSGIKPAPREKLLQSLIMSFKKHGVDFMAWPMAVEELQERLEDEEEERKRVSGAADKEDDEENKENDTEPQKKRRRVKDEKGKEKKEDKDQLDKAVTDEEQAVVNKMKKSMDTWGPTAKVLPVPSLPRSSHARRPVGGGGDARYDGPKHRRTRSYWFEEVCEELDPKLDAAYYDHVMEQRRWW